MPKRQMPAPPSDKPHALRVLEGRTKVQRDLARVLASCAEVTREQIARRTPAPVKRRLH